MLQENISNNLNLSILPQENVKENITAFIEATLGDSHINWSTLIPLTIIYSIFLIVGICGNLATCIVIISNEYMRTPTNAYLLNLAIADIATLVISKWYKLIIVKLSSSMQLQLQFKRDTLIITLNVIKLTFKGKKTPKY